MMFGDSGGWVVLDTSKWTLRLGIGMLKISSLNRAHGLGAECAWIASKEWLQAPGDWRSGGGIAAGCTCAYGGAARIPD